ncbi:uracil-xanthine permease, partial [Klebsiella pneumoniae]|nr:uracil-xanthine permease [Klebsiella pneumoniae]
MEIIYHVNDRPPFGRLLLFAFQQILSIIAGTITLPLIVGNGMSQSSALLGASIGTIVYLLFTKFKSP